MPQSVTIQSLPQAFGVIKQMQLEHYEWSEDCRGAGREVHVGAPESRMTESIECHVDGIAKRVRADRRNGPFHSHLLTDLGCIEPCAPRNWHFIPFKFVQAYARRAGYIDHMILACFDLAHSTRKVARRLTVAALIGYAIRPDLAAGIGFIA